MKKTYIVLLFALAAATTNAQLPGASGYNLIIPLPMNGNTTFGQTYSNTACGLNYVQASKTIETRYNQYETNSALLGTGLPTTLSVSGLPLSNTIVKAYIWYLVSYTETTAPSTTVAITNPISNTTNTNSNIVGTDGSKCWVETGTAVYRSDVTSSISGNGNYILNIVGFGNPAVEVDGASLIIIYKDNNATYQGTLNIWDGAIEESGPTAPLQTMNGFSVCSTPSSARAFSISSDHQDNIAPTHSTTLNGVAGNFPNTMFNYDEAPVTLTAGQTTSTFDIDGSNGSDCYLWGVMGLYYQTTNCAVCSPCLTTTVTVDSIKNTTACTLNNGAIYISASTNAPPLSFSWSNGATTQNISGLAPGTYIVSVKDTTNCTTSFSFSVSSPSNINIYFDSITTVFCKGTNGIIRSVVSGGAVPYTYNWSTGATTQNISGLPYGIFTLTVTDNNGCVAFGSASDEATYTVSAPSICMVTVDSISKYNVIMWDKNSFNSTDSFIVYREIGTNNYQPLGAVPYSALSLFVDTVRTRYFPNTGDPNAGTYRYKLGVRDSCGNVSSLSLYHNTIYMQNNSGAFSWSQLYTIENSANPVISYILMRDDYTTGNWHAVSSVAGTQQTVIDPNYLTYQNTASWRVETQWNITCTPTLLKNPVIESFIASRSNLYKATGAGVNELNGQINISISPNPTNGNFNIQVSKDENMQINIYDVIGECIYQHTSISANFQIDLDEAKNGVYFLQLITEHGTATKKLIINK